MGAGSVAIDGPSILLSEHAHAHGRAVLLALVALTACARQRADSSASSPAPDAAATAPREVAFAGCRRVRAGPACEVAEDRGLRLWIADGPAVRLRSDRGALALPAGARVGGGALHRVELAAGLAWIEIEDDDPPARPPWRLALRDTAEHPVLARARRLRATGDVAGAEAALRDALDTLPAEERDRAQALLARLALARGQPEEAARGLRASIDKARAAGRISEAVDDACALAFTLAVHLQRFAEARAALDDVAPLAASFPEGRARLPYYAAEIRANSGDIRGALREFRLAAERAARLGLELDESNARQEVADTMARMGRVEEALAMQRALVAAAAPSASPDPCLRAEPLIALSWYAILAQQQAAREGRPASVEDAGGAIRRARAALSGCADSFSLQVALTNEALYALEVGDLALARARLRELRRAPGARAQNLSVWQAEVDARLALAEGSAARALASFRHQEDAARATADGDGVFRAQVGQGRALRALGQTVAAARRYQQAELSLTAELADVPLGEGKETFAGMRGESARELVAALLDGGDAAGALRAARLARARVLGAATRPQRIDELPPVARAQWEALVARYRQVRHDLDAQAAADRWRPSSEREALRPARELQLREIRGLADQLTRLLEGDADGAARAVTLRAPDAGELLLAYFPLADGWVGLAATGGEVRARRLGAVAVDAPAETLSRQLLQPFERELVAARALRLLPYGALERVDFHALPFAGGVLVDRLPVAYGIDVARGSPDRARGDKDSGAPAPGRALLVADPDLSLPGARIEADAVRPLLEARGVGVEVLRGERATRATILAELSGARLFHFAGHGWFSGIDGIDSALGVTQGGRILLGDIMTLPRAPELVVLSACEAARAGAGPAAAALPAGWGIAQAFLVAGARAVVAPNRPVRDDAALAFMRAFYGALAGDAGVPSAAEAVRVAQRASRAGAGADAAASFRVLVP